MCLHLQNWIILLGILLGEWVWAGMNNANYSGISRGLWVGVLWAGANLLFADVPGIINYQGRLVVSGTNYTGTAQFKFLLVNGSGSGAYWSHEGATTSTNPPNSAVTLPVSQGLYSLLLGDTTILHMAEIPASIFTNLDVRLRVWVNTGNEFRALTPDARLAAVGYAFRAQSAVTADTARQVTNFTGTLGGDVTGSQSSTVVARVGGLSAAALASGAAAANSATRTNLPETLVKRGTDGGFSAGTISAAFVGSGAGLTNLNADKLASGSLPDARLSANVALLNANQSFSGSNTFTGPMLSTNGGNIFAGKFAGDGAGLTNLPPSGTTTYTGSLSGDVTGTLGTNHVAQVAGLSATSVASGALAALAATNANAPGTLVKRDEAGNFSAGIVTGDFEGSGAGLTNLNASNLISGNLADARLSANVARLNANQTYSGSNAFIGPLLLTNAGNLIAGKISGDGSGLTNLPASGPIVITNTLSGDVTGPLGTTRVAQVAGLGASAIAAGANAANAATNANVPNTLVKREADGSFAAGTITGAFMGSGASLTNLNALNVSSGTLSDARLSPSVAMVQRNQTFSGANVFAGQAVLTNAANIMGGIHYGDGAGLTNLSASNIVNWPPSGTMLASALAQDTNLINAGYRLTMSIAPPAWITGSTSGGLEARTGHSAVWDGAEMLIWGGALGSGQFVASGAKYLPATDQWQLLSTIGAPSARSGHTAVWTGTQLIVWGGVGDGGYAPTGGVYTVSSGIWTGVSPSNAPAARDGHIAIWTGTHMLIWGGQNGNGLLNDGALYNPATDQWSALGVANPPAARSGATALWTGTQLFIWGGRGSAGALGDGATLVFAGSSPSFWNSLSTLSAPNARQNHTAVWTGTKMLIWGGRNSSGALNDGAAYSPTTGTWQALGANNVPAARYDHAAVWSGQEMLIFGGATSTGELASAASYDPVSGLWQALSTSGNPQPRALPGAVWSGTELVVFGGRSSGQAVAALQRLAPQPTWYFYRKL